MAADKYRSAEDEYFKLRGQFDTGRLTQEQFDERLRELMIQDAQGRYWMLGADSGKWYYYDGASWVQGEPYAGATPPPLAEAAARPVSSPTSPPAPRSTPSPASPPSLNNARSFPLVPILILLVLVILGVAAFLIFQNRERIFVAQQPQQITPVLPPTITRAPSPTPLGALSTAPATLAPLPTAIPATLAPTDAPTLVPPTAAPTNISATDIPAITVIVVTSEPPPTIELPTLLPSATTPPTVAPTVAPTKIPATATKPPPTNTAVPNFPPGVYVTKLRLEPAQPKTNQDITFTATFVNTTGSNQGYNWLAQIYRVSDGKRHGDTKAKSLTVATGTNEYSVGTWKRTGPGGCVSYFVMTEFEDGDKNRIPFLNTDGNQLRQYFDVCP